MSTALKSLPSAPEKTPSRKSSKYAPPSGTGSTEPTANIGPTPKIPCVTKPAAIAAPRTPMSTCGEKLLESSSKEKTRLVRGALKMAAKPAPAPAVRRKRSSERERPAKRLTPAPTQAPISTLGPPRPSESPAPMASTTLMNLPKSTRFQRRRLSPRRTPLMSGIPPPPTIESRRMSRQTTTESASRTSKYPAVHAGGPSRRAS